MPEVIATQGQDGTVSVNVQENVGNPFQPVGQGISGVTQKVSQRN